MALETTALYRKRVRTNRLALVLSILAMVIGMGFLAWILAVLLYKGFGALSLTLFTASTPAPGSEGGLANAILGSAAMLAPASRDSETRISRSASGRSPSGNSPSGGTVRSGMMIFAINMPPGADMKLAASR